MIPPNQSFRTDNLQRRQINLRLIVKLELLVTQAQGDDFKQTSVIGAVQAIAAIPAHRNSGKEITTFAKAFLNKKIVAA